MELGEHFDSFSDSQLLKIEAAMAFWVLIDLLSQKNHYKSLLGPYEGKLQ